MNRVNNDSTYSCPVCNNPPWLDFYHVRGPGKVNYRIYCCGIKTQYNSDMNKSIREWNAIVLELIEQLLLMKEC